MTITDGEPTGPGERMETTRNVIARAKDYLSTLPYGAGSTAFMFAQVLTPCKALESMCSAQSPLRIEAMS